MSTVHSERNFNDWVTFSFFPLDKHEHMSIFLLPSPLVCISGSKKDKKHHLGFNNPNTCPQQREKASEQLWQFHIACWATLYLFLLFKLSYRRYKLVWNELAQVFIHQINIVPFFQTLVNLLSKLTGKNSLASKPFSSLSTPAFWKEGCHLSSN